MDINKSSVSASSLASSLGLAKESMVHDYVEVSFIPLLGIADSKTSALLQSATEKLVLNNLPNSNQLNNVLFNIHDLMTSKILDSHDVETIDALASSITSDDLPYAEAVARLTVNSGPFIAFGLDKTLPDIQASIIEQSNDFSGLRDEERCAALRKVIFSENEKLMVAYSNSRQPAMVSINNYNNILDPQGIKKSPDGRADYISWQVIGQHPWYFHGASQDEKQEAAAAIKSLLVSVQDPSKDQDTQENQAKRNYDRIQILFLIPEFVESFLNGEALSANTYHVMSQFQGEDLRAGYAVAMLDRFLSDNPGYTPLGQAEKIQLFRQYVDEQYASSETKATQGFHDVTVETIIRHAAATGNYELIDGRFTIDAAADFITNSSKDAAENRWENNTQYPINPIEIDRPRGLRRVLKSFDKEVTQVVVGTFKNSIQFGLSINGDKTTVGIKNIATGEISPISLSFNPKQQPKPLFSINPTSNVTSTNGLRTTSVPQIVLANSFLNSGTANDSSQSSCAVILEQARQDAFNSIFIPPEQAWLDYWKYVESENPAASKENVNPQQTTGSTTKATVVTVSQKPAVKHGVGEKIIDMILPPAEAVVPLVAIALAEYSAVSLTGIEVAAMAAAVGTGTAAWLASRSSTIDASNELTIYTFPVLSDNDFAYWGQHPEDKIVDLGAYKFPVGKPLPQVIATPKTEMETDWNLNITNIPGQLLLAYNAYKNTEKVSVKSQIKDAQLPNDGKIRYIPPSTHKPENDLPRGSQGGYVDKFKNEWVKGPSRTPGEAFEWDVQLSKSGKQQLGWLSKDEKHINVSLKGKITHR